ncbi:T9SS type A sorting domain-containing protein, partial [Seonamhaeicola maritimus]
HLGYEDNVSFDGVTNANQLSGCYVLSNAITVNRTAINGGSITGGTDNSFSFTVGDETADKIAADAITLTGNVGTNSKWLVTDEDGTKILGVHDNYTDPDFDGAAAGTCKLWHLSYEDGIEGLTVPDEGDHLVSGLTGACFDLSNPITIVRTASTSGKIALYPNPSKGSVTVKLINFSADNVNISLFNLNNSMIYNEDITFRTVFKKQSLDVSDYDSGIYFVKVTNLDSGAVAIKQLVID